MMSVVLPSGHCTDQLSDQLAEPRKAMQMIREGTSLCIDEANASATYLTRDMSEEWGLLACQ